MTAVTDHAVRKAMRDFRASIGLPPNDKPRVIDGQTANANVVTMMMYISERLPVETADAVWVNWLDKDAPYGQKVRTDLVFIADLGQFVTDLVTQGQLNVHVESEIIQKPVV